MLDKADSDRFLVYATKASVAHLANCEHHVTDGTFDSVPLTEAGQKVFAQVYCIHSISSSGWSGTAVIALLCTRSGATYKRLFTVVHQLLAEATGKDAPTGLFVLDFEVPARGALMTVFELPRDPEGCLFHIVQQMMKHMRHEGLYAEWASSFFFRRWFNVICHMPYLHPGDVKKVYAP